MAQLPQELIRGNKEWVLLENSPNNDHRMGAHNINDDTPAKLGEVVGSYNGIFIPGQNIVQPGLVLHKSINTWPVFQSPFHMGN